MVFGNNTASDVLKLSKIPPAAKVQVMLLFVYNRSWEIFGNAQETFLFTVEKTNTGVHVCNNISISMEEMIDRFL